VRTATVGQAAEQTGWSPRMLRYLERAGLVVPGRTGTGSPGGGEDEVLCHDVSS